MWGNKWINLPKNLLLLGTAASWYVGIVYLNSDLAFTLTNVVAHGVPYIALIWLYGRTNQGSQRLIVFKQSFFNIRMIPAYLGILIFLAYAEEGLWDGFVWKDHMALFPGFSNLPTIQDRTILSVLIPLLALPQSTHYIFDAFLWRVRGKDSKWKNMLLYPERREI